MNHLRAGVGLLKMIGERHRIKFAGRIIPDQDAAWVLPRDRRAGLDLRPGNLRIFALTFTAFGHKIINPALSGLRITGIPILYRRILDLGMVERHKLYDRRVTEESVPKMIEALTNALHESSGAAKESIHVIIQGVPAKHWGQGGKPGE